MRNLILATFIVVIMAGCKKEIIYEDTLPQLEIIVLTESGTVVSDAVVQLYYTEEDWRTDENTITSSITDSNGSVMFSKLEERIYYFYASKDNRNNAHGISYFENPLKVNEIKVLETIIQ